MKMDWNRTDHFLAARHATNRKVIAEMRKAASAPVSPGRKANMSAWSEKLTDAENARRLRVSVHTVIRHRQRLRLPPVRDPSPPVSWADVDWSRDDASIASEKKCHVISVWKARRKFSRTPRPKQLNMKVDSMKMSAENWAALVKVATDTESLYSGLPSWRRLMLRIARGEVRCSEAPKAKRRPKE